MGLPSSSTASRASRGIPSISGVLHHLEQPDGSQGDPELLEELPAQRGLGGLAELDAASDGTMEGLPFHPVEAVEYEDPARADGQPDRDVPDGCRMTDSRAAPRAAPARTTRAAPHTAGPPS